METPVNDLANFLIIHLDAFVRLLKTKGTDYFVYHHETIQTESVLILLAELDTHVMHLGADVALYTNTCHRWSILKRFLFRKLGFLICSMHWASLATKVCLSPIAAP